MISDTVAVALITAGTSMVTLAVSVFTAWQAHRTEKNTNSMKDALVKAEKGVSFAEGREEGKAAGKRQEKANAAR